MKVTLPKGLFIFLLINPVFSFAQQDIDVEGLSFGVGRETVTSYFNKKGGQCVLADSSGITYHNLPIGLHMANLAHFSFINQKLQTCFFTIEPSKGHIDSVYTVYNEIKRLLIKRYSNPTDSIKDVISYQYGFGYSKEKIPKNLYEKTILTWGNFNHLASILLDI